MDKTVRSTSVLVVAVGLATAVSHAATPPAAAKGSFQSDLLAVLGDAEKKVMSLEEAVPQNKFDWRPAPGVRSIAEAYLHIAFGNYGITKAATGKEPPADAGWEMNRAKWDTQTTDKAAIKKILEKSFAHVHAVVGALPEADLDKKVNFFGHEMTSRAVLMVLEGHVNEHLGQEVAYARANNVTPPWSKGDK
jgi:uncharacterized damage-inducible protein DinB